jgi:hypothetical protein
MTSPGDAPREPPAPQSFNPVLSISKCTGPVPMLLPDRDCGTSSVSARRLRVEWSGTASRRPRRPIMEPIKPSVWRRARGNTAGSVNAVRIASVEYQACPPRVARGAARQAAIAYSVNHTVRLPR